MQIFIGWDPRDELAARVCVKSLRAHTRTSLDIHLIRDHEVRKSGLYDRPYAVEPSGQMVDGRDHRPFSTLFAFTRFLTPHLATDDWALFVDADFMFRADVSRILQHCSDTKALMCVQHDYSPRETVKMDGVSQAVYRRKNWSSLMLMRTTMCRQMLDRHDINHQTGRWLHGLEWCPNDFIGELPETWNWLDGWSTTPDPAAVHFTKGTPDMIGDESEYAGEWHSHARDCK